MDVETLAVNKVADMIARCSHLLPLISTNDKTPFTDGHIDVYSGLGRSKADWTGRVSVQVKGRTHSAKQQQTLSFPISRTDLAAYRKDSGVLYFVVAVSPDGSARTVFYALLSPFTIDALIAKAPAGTAKLSIPFKRFPNEPSAIEAIVALALKTREQVMSTGFDPILLEESTGFTIHSSENLDFDAPLTLDPTTTDFAMVVHTKNGMSVPIGGVIMMTPESYQSHISDLSISSGSIIYTRVSIRRIEKDAFEIELSTGLKLLLNFETGKWSASFHLTSDETLAARLKSVEFFLSLIDSRTLEVAGKSVPFDLGIPDDVDSLRAHLINLRELNRLFECLSVDTELVNLKDLDEAQAEQLAALHEAFVEGREVVSQDAKPSRVVQRIGHRKVMYLVTAGSGENRWKLVDPFSPVSRNQFLYSPDDNPTESFPVTAYDIVESEHLPDVLNMRLELIVPAYEAIAELEKTSMLANQRVLSLLGAADTDNGRRDEFLDAAERLNDWLIQQGSLEDHHQINRWQILHRRGALTPAERKGIRVLKRRNLERSARNSAEIDLACALLLGADEEVAELLLELPEETLQLFKTWPIWKLRNEAGAPETHKDSSD